MGIWGGSWKGTHRLKEYSRFEDSGCALLKGQNRGVEGPRGGPRRPQPWVSFRPEAPPLRRERKVGEKPPFQEPRPPGTQPGLLSALGRMGVQRGRGVASQVAAVRLPGWLRRCRPPSWEAHPPWADRGSGSPSSVLRGRLAQPQPPPWDTVYRPPGQRVPLVPPTVASGKVCAEKRLGRGPGQPLPPATSGWQHRLAPGLRIQEPRGPRCAVPTRSTLR